MNQADSLAFGGTKIDYSIRRTNRRKTIAITVSPDKSVTVAVPKGTRRTIVTKKVQQKAEWIVRQQERLSAYPTTEHLTTHLRRECI